MKIINAIEADSWGGINNKFIFSQKEFDEISGENINIYYNGQTVKSIQKKSIFFEISGIPMIEKNLYGTHIECYLKDDSSNRKSISVEGYMFRYQYFDLALNETVLILYEKDGQTKKSETICRPKVNFLHCEYGPAYINHDFITGKTIEFYALNGERMDKKNWEEQMATKLYW